MRLIEKGDSEDSEPVENLFIDCETTVHLQSCLVKAYLEAWFECHVCPDCVSWFIRNTSVLVLSP